MPSLMQRENETADRLGAIIATQKEIVSAGLDLGKVMDVVVRRAQALTLCTGAVVELSEGEEMVSRAASGSEASSLGMRSPKAGSLSGMCVGAETAMRCDDIFEDSRVDKKACERSGMRSMIVVPLRHFSSVVGVLKVISSEPNHFNDLDIQTLQLISGLTAGAMSHASEFETKQDEIDAMFHKATHDPLTGLANRALYLDRLRHALTVVRREKRGLAVLLLDVDHIKRINENLGPLAGDAALKEVAKRTNSALREADTLARVGGDKFAVTLNGVEDCIGAARTVQRITNLFQAPLEFEGASIFLSVSIGSAVCPDNGEDSESLMHAADLAITKAKRDRRAPR